MDLTTTKDTQKHDKKTHIKEKPMRIGINFGATFKFNNCKTLNE
jgi:hypothetical protein